MAYETHKFEDGQVLGAQQLNEMDEELAREKSWNDLTDKPFDSEMGTVTVEYLPETTKAFTGAGDQTVYFPYDPLVDGQTYTVIWDGTSYTCTAATYPYNEHTLIGMGNEYALGGENTGEPFAIGYIVESGNLNVIPMTDGTSHTFGISYEEEKEIIHHLDPKYIKDMYSSKNVVHTIVEERELKFTDNEVQVEELWPIKAGEKYTVTWDGKRYECTAFSTLYYEMLTIGLGNLSFMGGEDTGEPFLAAVIESMGTSTVITADSNSHTASITQQEEEIKKIDNKYINAEWMATEGEINVYIMPKTTKYLADDDGRIGAEISELLNAGITVGEKYYVEFNGTEYYCLCQNPGIGKWFIGNAALLTGEGAGTGEPFLIVCADLCVLFSEQVGEAEISVYTKGTGPVPLPEKYIPGDVARTKDMGFETYNLFELGLPRIPKDGSTVSLTTDQAAKLKAKLEKRPVWIGFGLGDSASDEGTKRILGLGYLDTGSSAIQVQAPIESHSLSYEIVEFTVFNDRIEARYVELFQQKQNYLYLRSTGGKVFQVSVDDSGTLSAAEVTA